MDLPSVYLTKKKKKRERITNIEEKKILGLLNYLVV